jgi:hypothetical protein
MDNNMGVDELVNTRQTVTWQRDVSSFLGALTDFVNAFDVDKLSDEQKGKALKALQRLVPPSAPATDGGISSTLRNVLGEVKRMNNVSFAGGRVVNNAMGIGLFLDPDEVSELVVGMKKGMMLALYIDPDPHSHTVSLSHDPHSHSLSTITIEDLGHSHSIDHTHTIAHTHTVTINCQQYTTDSQSTNVSGNASTSYTSDETTGITATGTVTGDATVTAHAGNTGGTNLDIVSEAPAP